MNKKEIEQQTLNGCVWIAGAFLAAGLYATAVIDNNNKTITTNCYQAPIPLSIHTQFQDQSSKSMIVDLNDDGIADMHSTYRFANFISKQYHSAFLTGEKYSGREFWESVSQAGGNTIFARRAGEHENYKIWSPIQKELATDALQAHCNENSDVRERMIAYVDSLQEE